MDGLHIDIVTPERLAFSGRVVQAQVPGFRGELGILPGHKWLLTLLRSGVVTLKDPSGEQRFVVGPGFLEVGPDKVMLLTDACIDAAHIDRDQAQRAYQQAEAALTQVGTGAQAWKAAQEQLALALAKLSLF